MPLTVAFPRSIRSDRAGFSWLAEVGSLLHEQQGATIAFSDRNLQWFDSNLCSPLGALLYQAQLGGSSILLDAPGPILGAWSRNGFAYAFGGGDMIDTFDTTLIYQRFERQHERRFAAYVQRELMPKDIPKMTPPARRQFERNLQEIFNNAVNHAASERGVFSCGQFFPHKNYINFTVCDLGVGFRLNAHRKTGQALSATQAISWASQDGHTSRTGAIPGGLGLGLLREFVLRNRGSLQIVSEDGYWLFDARGEHSWELKQAFPGTFVNLRIMTNDESLYKAAGEVDAGVEEAAAEDDIDIFGPSPKIEAQ